MNDLDHQIPAQNDLARLQVHYDALRQLVNTMLILLVVVSGTLTIFLLHQYKLVHREVVNFRLQYNSITAQYQQIKPKMDEFERRIGDFAHTHPDFAAILSKYTPKPPAGVSATQTKN